MRSPRLPSPEFKLGAALVIILGTALLPRRPTLLYLVPTAVLLVLWPLCRMPFLYTVRRLLVAEFFIIGIAVLSLLAPAAAA